MYSPAPHHHTGRWQFLVMYILIFLQTSSYARVTAAAVWQSFEHPHSQTMPFFFPSLHPLLGSLRNTTASSHWSAS